MVIKLELLQTCSCFLLCFCSLCNFQFYEGTALQYPGCVVVNTAPKKNIYIYWKYSESQSLHFLLTVNDSTFFYHFFFFFFCDWCTEVLRYTDINSLYISKPCGFQIALFRSLILRFALCCSKATIPPYLLFLFYHITDCFPLFSLYVTLLGSRSFFGLSSFLSGVAWEFLPDVPSSACLATALVFVLVWTGDLELNHWSCPSFFVGTSDPVCLV